MHSTSIIAYHYIFINYLAIIFFPSPNLQAKTVAEQLAAKLNTKLNYQPKEEEEIDVIVPSGAPDTTFKKYEEELEINDFPQQARWKVTSKVCVNTQHTQHIHSFKVVLTQCFWLFPYFLLVWFNRRHWHRFRNILKLA